MHYEHEPMIGESPDEPGGCNQVELYAHVSTHMRTHTSTGITNIWQRLRIVESGEGVNDCVEWGVYEYV